MSPESELTPGARIEPRLVPCLCSGHTMNRDHRFGGRSANRATPAPLPPGSEVIVTQTVTVASGVVTDHFDHNSPEILRPRVARLDVHRMQVAATVRLCEPGMDGPLRATRVFSALPQALGELTVRLLHQARGGHDLALAPLLGELNTTRTLYPGTHLHVVYEIFPNDPGVWEGAAGDSVGPSQQGAIVTPPNSSMLGIQRLKTD